MVPFELGFKLENLRIRGYFRNRRLNVFCCCNCRFRFFTPMGKGQTTAAWKGAHGTRSALTCGFSGRWESFFAFWRDGFMSLFAEAISRASGNNEDDYLQQDVFCYNQERWKFDAFVELSCCIRHRRGSDSILALFVFAHSFSAK